MSNGLTVKSDSPILMFDTLHQLIETVEQIQQDEHLDLREEIAAAREALEDLQQWCDDESTAVMVNFEKWKEATRYIEALETLVPSAQP